MWKETFGLLAGLILTILIIYLAYRCSKLLAMKLSGSGSRRYMKEIDRMVVGSEEYITIARVGERYFLVGVTKQNINMLAELDEDSLVELSPDEFKLPSVNSPESEFLKRLRAAAADKLPGIKKDTKND